MICGIAGHEAVGSKSLPHKKLPKSTQPELMELHSFSSQSLNLLGIAPIPFKSIKA